MIAELPVYERVPAYHDDSPESRALIDVTTKAVLRCGAAFDDVALQFNVKTATWGLAEWERLYGVSPRPGSTLEERRAAVIARMSAQGTTTVERVRALATAITGYDCRVIEDAPRYTFSIEFLGTQSAFVALPAKTLAVAIDEIKPAHLLCILTPIRWGDLEREHLTWGQMEEIFPTWGDFEAKFYIHGAEDDV